MKIFCLATVLVSLAIVGCKSDTPEAAASPAATPAATPTPAAYDNGTTGDVSEANLTVKFYPGSTVAPGNVTGGKGVKDGVFQAAAFRVSKDSVDKVAAFYQDEMTKAGYKVEDQGGVNGYKNFEGTKDDKAKIKITVGKADKGDGSSFTIEVTRPAK